jgi:hypothetical protein
METLSCGERFLKTSKAQATKGKKLMNPITSK